MRSRFVLSALTFPVVLGFAAIACADNAPITVAKATAADAPAIARQKTCVISGEDLASMGGAIKLTRGNKAVFVCCEGCVAKVKANPDKYFGTTAPAPSPKAVATPATAAPITVAKATAADAPAIARQKVCVISGDDLHEMGMPLKITRGSRSVFVCCEGCVPKVKANPDKYFGASAPPVRAVSAAAPATADPHTGHHH